MKLPTVESPYCLHPMPQELPDSPRGGSARSLTSTLSFIHWTTSTQLLYGNNFPNMFFHFFAHAGCPSQNFHLKTRPILMQFSRCHQVIHCFFEKLCMFLFLANGLSSVIPERSSLCLCCRTDFRCIMN